MQIFWLHFGKSKQMNFREFQILNGSEWLIGISKLHVECVIRRTWKNIKSSYCIIICIGIYQAFSSRASYCQLPFCCADYQIELDRSRYVVRKRALYGDTGTMQYSKICIEHVHGILGIYSVLWDGYFQSEVLFIQQKSCWNEWYNLNELFYIFMYFFCIITNYSWLFKLFLTILLYKYLKKLN